MSVLNVPTTAEAHFSLARSFESRAKHREAAEAWVAGLQIDPTYLPGHLALARSLLALGLAEAAVTAGRQALMAGSESSESHEVLGQAYEACGKRGDAIEHYTRSLTLKPGLQRVAHRLSGILRAEGRLKAARTVLEKFSDPGSLFLLAGVVAELGAPQDAIGQLRQALKSQPRFPEALNSLAVLLRATGELEEAENCFHQALKQRPDFAPAWNNLANLHVELSRVDEAERCYTKAIQRVPDYAEAHTNRALVWLLQGRFQEGWQEYEWRWRQPGTEPRTLPRPEWDGGSIEGKTILLHAEQGAGDTIQFVRYARLLRARGASVMLHCQESLQSLLRGMPELQAVFSGRTPVPNFDVHAPLMSLPRLFGTSAATIPADVPYLAAPDDTPVPEPLQSAKGFRVGVVWRGNPGHRNDRNRSCPKELLSGLLQTSGVQFFSLQLDDAPPPPMIDLAPYLTDYAVTAACLSHLDLLITVDTSVAHLAGALGRPVWMLLPPCNDWRWLKDRQDTPWYPTMRLFRQAARAGWTAVLDQARHELYGLKDQE